MYSDNNNEVIITKKNIMKTLATLKLERIVLKLEAMGMDNKTATTLASNQIERENYVRPMSNNNEVSFKFDGTPRA